MVLQFAVSERLAEAPRKTPGREIRSAQVPARRHGDHFQPGIDPAHRLQHAEPVGRRHLQIGQHQIETALADEFGDILGILAALASDPGTAAHRGGHFELQGIVIDQQHAQSRLGRRLFGSGSRTPGRRFTDGDRHDEFAPLSETAFERNRTVQQLHETVDDRQPQPESVDSLRRTQTHELGEDAFPLLAADAAARVAHREDQPPPHHVHAERHRPLVGEFQGVGNQVVGDLTDVERIARHLSRGGRFSLQTQFQPLCGGRGGKSRTNNTFSFHFQN